MKKYNVPTPEDGILKFHCGWRVFVYGIKPDMEKVKGGVAIMWRGILDIFNLYKYPEIK